jgi:ectoine hydroxylase-related dioxygenase (phytanoyl-CoA dioxygenase family)
VPAESLDSLAHAYDRGMTEADSVDVREGRTTVRVHDFVNRGMEFDPLYVYVPLLDACCQVIGRPFKLSAMLGRTLLPGMSAQELHVDCPRAALAGPMVGFIFMIDEFRNDNGATCFLPGSHEKETTDLSRKPVVPTCGPAGSMLIYHGSVRHGHGANTSGAPRRSIQGAFIPREGTATTDFASRMKAETLGRIGPMARYLLAV